eukprot:Rhum_TRINITY_DN14550_c3_g1::Rhum_TRINITY_DN14550_c3_g1_i1::g.97120::m.97120
MKICTSSLGRDAALHTCLPTAGSRTTRAHSPSKNALCRMPVICTAYRHMLTISTDPRSGTRICTACSISPGTSSNLTCSRASAHTVSPSVVRVIVPRASSDTAVCATACTDAPDPARTRAAAHRSGMAARAGNRRCAALVRTARTTPWSPRAVPSAHAAATCARLTDAAPSSSSSSAAAAAAAAAAATASTKRSPNAVTTLRAVALHALPANRAVAAAIASATSHGSLGGRPRAASHSLCSASSHSRGGAATPSPPPAASLVSLVDSASKCSSRHSSGPVSSASASALTRNSTSPRSDDDVGPPPPPPPP